MIRTLILFSAGSKNSPFRTKSQNWSPPPPVLFVQSTFYAETHFICLPPGADRKGARTEESKEKTRGL